MVRRHLALGSVMALALLLAAACGGGTSTSGNTAPIKIGVQGPFTGPNADPGIAIKNAAELAAENINASGGINGRKIQLMTTDDACDAQQGVQAVEQLITQGVVAMVGGYCSGASIPESDILHRSGDIPFITAASSNPKFTEQGYDNVYRMVSRDDEEAPATVNFFHDFLHVNKLAIMDDNSTYALGVADSAKQTAQADGMTVTYFDAIVPGQQDYTAALEKVATTHPDLLYYTGYYTEFGLLAKEFGSLSLSYKLDGDSACVDPSVLKVAGTALVSPSITLTTLPTTEFIHNSKNDSFTSKYQKKFGEAPGDYSSYEYDGMMALAQALRNDGGKTDAKSLNNALHKVKTEGITGTVQFDKAGDRPTPEFLAVKATGNPPQFAPFALRENGTWKKVSA
jgi:ABC-type branched-subunit amino acid transport system substrate-binding protein